MWENFAILFQEQMSDELFASVLTMGTASLIKDAHRLISQRSLSPGHATRTVHLGETHAVKKIACLDEVVAFWQFHLIQCCQILSYKECDIKFVKPFYQLTKL